MINKQIFFGIVVEEVGRIEFVEAGEYIVI
jgi:hypothetical protein